MYSKSKRRLPVCLASTTMKLSAHISPSYIGLSSRFRRLDHIWKGFQWQIRQHVILCDFGIELQSGFWSSIRVQWPSYAGHRRWMPSAKVRPASMKAVTLVPYQRRQTRPPSGNWVRILQSRTGCAPRPPGTPTYDIMSEGRLFDQ